MKIYNGVEKNKEIDSLDKWFELCPPMKKDKHWKDYRSAKEMAKFWLDQNKYDDFQNFIRKAIPDFTYDYIIPEFASTFDTFDSPRKHDLYIVEKFNKAVITVEGKADEPFGSNNFGNQFIETIKTKTENQDSKAVDRMVNLYLNYFHSNGNIFPIMYQLLYWFAGSLIDTIKEDTDNFVMVLQEFKSAKTDPGKLTQNHSDFEKFVNFISEGKYSRIENRQIIGPLVNIYTNDKNLYIGYYSTELE
jgi:hypothetical protein